MPEWSSDDEMLLLQEGVNGPFRGFVYAIPIALAIWFALGLIVWALW